MWVLLVVFAPKEDRNLRFCFEYRKHNAVTVLDSYLLPHMDEYLDSL